jgi:hypothetical protein
LKKLRIGLPPWPYLGYLYTSFLKLIISLDTAKVTPTAGGVELEARGPDMRPVLGEAIRYAAELASDYRDRGLRNEFPLSSNDGRWIKPKILDRLGLPKESDLLDALNEYAHIVEDIDEKELENALYPYSRKGEFSPFQVFLLELYSLTRAPLSDGYYELGLDMNIHQMLICTAGYVAARHVAARVDNEQVAVLIFPLSLRVIRYDFYRNLRNSLTSIPGIRPEEAVILWFAIHLPADFPEDVLVLSVREPFGPQQTSPVASIPVHITELKARAGEAIERLKEIHGIEMLLETSLKRGGRPPPDVEDAAEYVKLLYLAIQKGFERERLELMLRASRKEAMMATALDKASARRRIIASVARAAASRLMEHP